MWIIIQFFKLYLGNTDVKQFKVTQHSNPHPPSPFSRTSWIVSMGGGGSLWRHRLTITQVTLRRKVIGMEGLMKESRGLTTPKVITKSLHWGPSPGENARTHTQSNDSLAPTVFLTHSFTYRHQQWLTYDVAEGPDRLFTHILMRRVKQPQERLYSIYTKDQSVKWKLRPFLRGNLTFVFRRLAAHRIHGGKLQVWCYR